MLRFRHIAIAICIGAALAFEKPSATAAAINIVRFISRWRYRTRSEMVSLPANYQ